MIRLRMIGVLTEVLYVPDRHSSDLHFCLDSLQCVLIEVKKVTGIWRQLAGAKWIFYCFVISVD